MLSSTALQLCRQCRQQFISLPLRYPRAVIRRPSQADVELHSWLLNMPVRFAGHSHWQNIKKTKTSKDDQRQKIINTICNRIRVAVREGGGSMDPKINSQLNRVLEEGKSKDVPNATMFEALRKLEKTKDIKGSQIFVEGRALNNCQVIIEMYSEKPKRTRQYVQSVLKKYAGCIGEEGTAKPYFNYKGVVYVCNEEGKLLSKDEALEKAIEAGAEDVIDGIGDDEKSAFKFICEPKELHVVKKALDDCGLETGAARLEFVPHTFVLLESAGLELAVDMRDALLELDETVRVYDNIAAANAET